MNVGEILSTLSPGYVYTVHNVMELLTNTGHDKRAYGTIGKHVLTACRQGKLQRQRIAKQGSPFGYKLI